MPGSFIKSGQTRPKLVNGDQEQLTKVVKCRSQESHDSFQAITSVISGVFMKFVTMVKFWSFAEDDST